ncbi:Tetratricopeptide repeat protein 25 [Nowakowskiella sp. JEL0407]|nr:Tetratricopeptide repeat protein 25 [Nowakowskiella sp. JEL0407]
MPDDSTDNEENQQNLISAFQTLSSEGDLLTQRNSYHEAISQYTKALQIRPTDKHCLVSRSKCFIQIGSPELALQDANACLLTDPEYFKGIYQKAESLYAMGDFEIALMYYHRGTQLRPELTEFRIGIQKSREAIENSIGNAKDHSIHVPLDLKKNLAAAVNNSDTGSGGPNANNGNSTGKSGKVERVGNEASMSPGADLITRNLILAIKNNPLTSGMEYKLLAELYEDKVYLQQMLGDKDFINHPNTDVLELVEDGLRYLHARTEFWRQQNPLYARPKPKLKGRSK